VLLVVPEAALAAGGPAHLGMEAQGAERVTGLAICGARRGGVDRHDGGACWQRVGGGGEGGSYIQLQPSHYQPQCVYA
jgi:hypothetical protein